MYLFVVECFVAYGQTGVGAVTAGQGEGGIPGLEDSGSLVEKGGAGGREGRLQVGAEIIPGITRARESALLPTLRSVVEIQKLSGEEAAQGYVSRIIGVVTVHVPGTDQTYVEDKTGGVYVGQVEKSAVGSELKQGQLVEVLGKTVRGRFTKHLVIDPNYASSIRVLGEDDLPDPVLLTGETLTDPRNDAKWGEVSGVVRRVKLQIYQGKPWALIRLSSGNIRFEAMCFLPEGSVIPENLVGAEIRMHGVPSSVVSDRGQFIGRQLIVDSPRDITVLRPADQGSVSVAVRTIESISKLEIGQRRSPRVRVEGVVTFSIPERGFYVSDGTGSIRVENSERFPPVGSKVDVVGFAEWGEWSPVLQDSTVSLMDGEAKVEAVPVSVAELGSGDFDGALVRVDATLLHIARPAIGALMVLQSGGRTFEARFATQAAESELKSIPEQSRVRLSGVVVCQGAPDSYDRKASLDRRDLTQAVSFELLLPSVRTVEVLSKPDWWNQTRITIALGGLGCLALATLAWVLTLRVRVGILTEINSAQRVREATFEERARVARELHDSVEQELAGLTIQLDAVRATLNHSPERAGPAVETARAMLRHTREEARRSIWDLRSLVLERGDLPSAISAVCAETEIEGGAPIRLEVEGAPVRLSQKTELNLVRICQEATSNARKYSKAQGILVRLTYTEDLLKILIEDDGIGFEPSLGQLAKAGHFGLLHMRERAEKVGADLRIESVPGKGTQVSVVLSILSEKTIET